jgi:hypothetical protein
VNPKEEDKIMSRFLRARVRASSQSGITLIEVCAFLGAVAFVILALGAIR